MTRISAGFLLTVAISLIGASANATEMPTDAQKSAIKSNCRGDFIRHCAGVTPSGKPALVCLNNNMSSLSTACQDAVKPVVAETGLGG